MAESLLPIDRHQVPVTNCPPSFVRVQMHGKRRPPLAGRPFISGREKTASASVTLADNLRANAANRKKAVHGGTMMIRGAAVKTLLLPPRPSAFAAESFRDRRSRNPESITT